MPCKCNSLLPTYIQLCIDSNGNVLYCKLCYDHENHMFLTTSRLRSSRKKNIYIYSSNIYFVPTCKSSFFYCYHFILSRIKNLKFLLSYLTFSLFSVFKDTQERNWEKSIYSTIWFDSNSKITQDINISSIFRRNIRWIIRYFSLQGQDKRLKEEMTKKQHIHTNDTTIRFT